MTAPLRVEVALVSSAGGRDHNEDACGHWHDGRHLCCVLADGAGGHGGGDVASRLAVEHVLGAYAARPAHAPRPLRRLLRSAHEQVVQGRGAADAVADMHTTAVVLSLDLHACSALWAHCGDSRLYHLRGGRIVARTRDHSMVQSLVDGGLLEPAAARGHPQRNALYAALGSPSALQALEVVPEPVPLAAGDALLLCSDGLWDQVEDEAIEAALAAAPEPQAWLQALAAAAAASTDNVSALAVRLRAPLPGEA